MGRARFDVGRAVARLVVLTLVVVGLVGAAAGPASAGDAIGQVVDADFVGVADVDVHLCDVPITVCDFSTTTAPNGDFSFPNVPDGQYTLLLVPLDGTGLQSAEFVIEVSGENSIGGPFQLLALDPGPTTGSVDVLVTDPGGLPVSGATVLLFDPLSPGSSIAGPAAETGPGTYTFSDVPAGQVLAQVLSPFTRPELGNGISPAYPVEAGQLTTIPMQLALRGSIVGRVRDASGAPLGGATPGRSLCPIDPGPGVPLPCFADPANPDGSFTFPYVDSGVDFRLRASWFDGVSTRTAQDVVVNLAPGQTLDCELRIDGVSSCVAAVGTLQVTVTDVSGSPLAVVPVSIRLLSGGSSFADPTDENGLQTFSGYAPGTYEVTAGPVPGVGSGTVSRTVVISPSTTTSETIALPFTGIRGAIARGESNPGATIGAVIACQAPNDPTTQGLCGPAVLATGGGGGGAFTLGLTPGVTYNVAALFATGFNGSVVSKSPSTAVTLGAGEVVACAFQSGSPGAASCGVDDGDGVAEPPGYDGNGDGEFDDQQAHVTSLATAEGGGTVTIAAPGVAYALTDVSAQAAPSGLPPGVDLPLGVLGFSVNLPVGVTTADVELILPPGTNPVAYFKQLGTDWVEYPNAAISGDTVTLHLVDNDAFDTDPAVGVIGDPGGPVVGFLAPIEIGKVNAAKAGRTVPVKWRLTDSNGDPVADPTSFVSLSSAAHPCGGSDVIQINDATTAGTSGLQYLGDGYWQYNWKTGKTWSGQCRALTLVLTGDMGTRTAEFEFT